MAKPRMFLLTLLFTRLIRAFPAASSACATGVHMIVSRGTSEPQGEGILSTLVADISAAIPGSDSEALVYPASSDNIPSEAAGTHNLTRAIKRYVRSCPKTKIVLLGYSQGAQVTSDTLCGTGEVGATPTAPLEHKYGSHVAAVITYGDPSRVPGQKYDYGTGVNPGMWPRTNSAHCDPYANIMACYCIAGDPECDNKGTDFFIHLEYFSMYNTNATNFVVSKVGK